MDVETKELHPDYQIADSEPAGKFDLDLLEILLVLAKRKWFILRTTFAVMVVTALVLLLLKNDYSSTAVILPPRQESSISNLLSGQLGGLAALGAGNLSSGLLKNPNDVFSGLLLSRTITSRLVDKFDLKTYFHSKLRDDAIKSLLNHTKIELSKDNLIRITVTTHDAKFSSQLANAYVDELHDLNTNLSLTDSSQRRAFFQEQLDKEKNLLANAESNFKEVQKKTGLLLPNSQADMVARNVATLRAEISVREAELQSLKTFATDQNPDYIRLNTQVNALRQQLSQLENSEKTFTPGDIEVPTSKLPEVTEDYLRKYREVKLHEAIYELLVKQFEAAKIDEAKTAPMIQVVDRAAAPERKSSPHRTIITLGLGFVTFIFLCLWSILAHGYNSAMKDSELSSKITEIRTALSNRR